MADGNGPAGPTRVRVTTPGDWIAVDARRLSERSREPRDVPPEMRRALDYLAVAGDIMAEGAIFAAFLAEPGEQNALATMVSYSVAGLPETGITGLKELVETNPPKDTIEGSLVVDTGAAASGEFVRSRTLRQSILEVPSDDAVSFSLEYFFPVPGTADMLVTAFATPNARQEEEYTALFESIVGSLEFA